MKVKNVVGWVGQRVCISRIEDCFAVFGNDYQICDSL